ncbi:hypothetical protein [Gaiella sp.]|uniref:hypothetical protein n=1 Tax=Gaiella sp. TaxID=2663207 RepID=UPI0039836C02
MVDVIKLAISFFAGVAAACGVGWRVYKHRYERRDHIRVTAKLGFVGTGAELSVVVSAVNTDLRDVTISSVWLEAAGDDERTVVMFRPPLGSSLPGTIAGRAAGTTWFDVAHTESEGFAITAREIVGCIRTAADEEFRSAPTVILAAQ